MNVFRRFKALAASAVLFVAMAGFMFSASTPSAACCGDGVAAAAGAAQAGGAVVASVQAASASLITQLKWMEQSINNGFSRVADEVNKSSANDRLIAQGEVQAQTQLYLDEKRTEAAQKFEISPRACYDTAIGTATGVAAGETREGLDALNRQTAERVLNTPSTAAAINGIYATHTEKYCSAADQKAGRCRAVAAELQNADVRADAFLGKTALNTEQAAAAKAFINNVVAPIPTQNIPAGWEKTPQGKAFVAGQMIEQAATSVAANSLNAALAERMPVQGLGSAAMLNRADVSERDIMEASVRGRHGSVQWRKALAQMPSAEALLRELNQQAALGLYIDYKSFNQLERIETLLATDLAISVRQDGEQRLQRARTAAAKAR